MEDSAVSTESRWQTLAAVLIALVTVAGALVAWRAAVAADAAGDADFAGVQATLNREETRALNTVDAYEAYGAFTTYQRYNALGDLIAQDQANVATEEEALLLESERADAHDLALASQHLFPNRFLNRDGTYSVQRQLGELWADAAREKDLNPEPQFAAADRLRARSNTLLGAVTLLALALVFYTLVEPLGARLQFPMLALGTLFFIAGAALALMTEFGG